MQFRVRNRYYEQHEVASDCNRAVFYFSANSSISWRTLYTYILLHVNNCSFFQYVPPEIVQLIETFHDICFPKTDVTMGKYFSSPQI